MADHMTLSHWFIYILPQRQPQRQKIRERQSQYNEGMVKQTRQLRKAPSKIDDMVAIKIYRVDKTSPVHPNMLLGKIMEIRKDYAKIVTPQGIIKSFISFSRLYPCTSRNVTLDYCKEISFTGACKQANNTCQYHLLSLQINEVTTICFDCIFISCIQIKFKA